MADLEAEPDLARVRPFAGSAWDSSEANIDALFRAAAGITPSVAEQAWLVAKSVLAGRNSDWLAAEADRRDAPALLGIFEEPGSILLSDNPTPEVT